MNLEYEILREHSKKQTLKIAAWIGRDRRRFGMLMELFLRGEYRVTQRAAWIVSICADNRPELLPSFLTPMIRKMQEPGVHVAVRRNVLRILQNIRIPKEMLGTVATVCFDYLASGAAPVAVKVFAMTVLGNIAEDEPDLKHELRMVIEQQIPYSTAGFRARAKRVLHKIGGGAMN